MYISGIHLALKYCKTCLFADNSNLLVTNKSLKRLQKHTKIDLCNLCD